MVELIVPLIIAGVSLFALTKKVDVYSSLVSGAADGLKILLRILPALVALLTAVHMLRYSGALDLIINFLEPLFSLFGIPKETAPLVLIRPISGSAALAIAADLIGTYGPDSEIGRITAIMLGSTETTFYTIAVYFGSTGISKTRHTIPAALIADITGFALASFCVKVLGL